MLRCYSVEVIIYLFSVLGWSAEVYPKCVAGSIFQYFNIHNMARAIKEAIYIKSKQFYSK